MNIFWPLLFWGKLSAANIAASPTFDHVTLFCPWLKYSRESSRDRSNENTTHVLLLHGVNFLFTHWLPACIIVDRKIVPATQLKVKWGKFFAIADTCSMAVHVVWPCGRKEGKLARCPAPHFEAWELDSGAKVTGRIKLAEGSATSSPGPSPRRFSKWRIVGRRPWPMLN